MKTIRLDDRTVLAMAQVAMEVYEIAIEVNDPDSIRAGMKDFFDRMQMDTRGRSAAWSKNQTHRGQQHEHH